MADDAPNPQNTQDNSQLSQSSGSQAPQDSTPPTPPTPTPQAQPTKSKYEELLEATLREQNARIQQMNSEITTLRQAPVTTAPEPAQGKSAADFFNDPHGSLDQFRKTINEDLQRTVAPLLDLAKGLRGDGTPYGNIKQQFKNDPRFSAILSDPKLEYAVDEIMRNQQATPELMKAAVIQAAGLQATGELDVALVASGVDINRFRSSTPAPAPTITTQTVPTVPAHMRPSAPAAPIPQDNRAQLPPLTALEKRLMSERGQTEEQFRAWINASPSEVATSTIGKVVK